MDEMVKFFEKDSFAYHLGVELMDVTEGRAKAKLEVKNHHLNSVGTVHGGVIFSLADAVFAVASNSHGTIAMAINANISYFKAKNGGTLFAEAKEVSLSPRLATYLIDVTDEAENLIALFQGTVYKKKDRIKTH